MSIGTLLFAAWLVGPPPSSASTPTATTKDSVAIDRVVLVVDHQPLLEQQVAGQAEKTGRFVGVDVTTALRELHGVAVVEADDAAPSIIVRLSWVDYMDSIYRIEVGTRRPGRPLQPVAAWNGQYGGYAELTGAVIERLPEVLETLREREVAVPPAAQAESATGPVPEPTEPERTRMPEERKVATLGPVGIAGLVVGVGGAALAGVGFGVAARELASHVDATDEQARTERVRWAGTYAWAATGLGVAAVGVTMLVVDLAVLRKRRQRTVALVPSLGPSRVGLELTARF